MYVQQAIHHLSANSRRTPTPCLAPPTTTRTMRAKYKIQNTYRSVMILITPPNDLYSPLPKHTFYHRPSHTNGSMCLCFATLYVMYIRRMHARTSINLHPRCLTKRCPSEPHRTTPCRRRRKANPPEPPSPGASSPAPWKQPRPPSVFLGTAVGRREGRKPLVGWLADETCFRVLYCWKDYNIEPKKREATSRAVEEATTLAPSLM